jgi:hypothetical protein
MGNECKENQTPDFKSLRTEIDEVKTRLAPDKLAKVLDRSYLSVSSLRFYLAVLSVVLTIFIAVAAYFGITSIPNVIKVHDELRDFEDFQRDVEEMMADVKEISVTFNKVAAERQGEFNARELQLLVFLAQKMDPNNPIINLNAASCSMKFNRYDEAINYCDLVIKLPNVSPKVSAQAKDLKTRAEDLRGKPPKVESEGAAKAGMRIGPYWPMRLHENTLKTLVGKGYLSVQEAQRILEESK